MGLDSQLRHDSACLLDELKEYAIKIGITEGKNITGQKMWRSQAKHFTKERSCDGQMVRDEWMEKNEDILGTKEEKVLCSP